MGRHQVLFYSGENWGVIQAHEIETKSEDQWDTQGNLADINHDGYPDLMVTHMKGTASIEVLMQIYFSCAWGSAATAIFSRYHWAPTPR